MAGSEYWRTIFLRFLKPKELEIAWAGGFGYLEGQGNVCTEATAQGSDKAHAQKLTAAIFVGYLGMNTQILYKNLIEAGLKYRPGQK